jgi:cation diffusion facilitator CzcD-associated flavoprotein CzcO
MDAPEHVDVLIVGAGLSGIGAACHLTQQCPDRSFAILEARDVIGGTWDLFRYPGVRSDSDMFTLGYRFRPWPDARAIADGPSILRYVKDTAREFGVDERIRFGHRAVRGEWSSADDRWTVECERTDTGERVTLTCGFLLGCTGYYRYDRGYEPDLPGLERFAGRVVHPQHWPEDLDFAGLRVLVVGSGATAVTLVPAMAERAAHVTMLQRSPSYVVSLPSRDPLAERLLGRLPARVVHPLMRWKNVLMQMAFFQLSRRRPKLAKALLRRGVARLAPPDLDIDTHFAPRYDPWDQRVCLIPDGDLFRALRSERADIVTDTIETFTEDGVRLASGRALPADVVVLATGLDLQALGGATLAVDGRELVLRECVGYKGMMLTGVPNAAVTLGYENASWTLKADLTAEYVCRLLNHMRAHGYTRAVPRPPAPGAPTSPWIDLTSGYVQRAIDRFPRQGPAPPWRVHQNYVLDVRMLRHGPVDDEMEFGTAVPAAPPAAAVPA